MAISLRQSYGKASAAIPLACMEDTVKVSGVQVHALFQIEEKDAPRGRNCTDVSELPSEHGVRTRN